MIYGKLNLVVIGLVIYSVAMMGALMGASVGYEAETAAEASITYNGTHVTTGTGDVTNVSVNTSDSDHQEQLYGYSLPEFELPTLPGEQYVQKSVNAGTEHLVNVVFGFAFGIAGLTATVTYHIQWVPQWLLSGFFQVLVIVPYGLFGLAGLQRLGEIYD